MDHCPNCGSPDIFRQHTDEYEPTEWICEACGETFFSEEDERDVEDEEGGDKGL